MRFSKLLKYGALIAALLLGYGLFVIKTGVGIPCVFNKVTGLYCPGCGCSRMIAALMQLRFKDAFHENMFVLCAAPFIAAAAVFQTKKAGEVLAYILAIVAVVFGVLRNIFPVLAPV